MPCDFTSFLTVFQSYQEDDWMIMKGCVQWNSVYGWEDFTSSEDRTRSTRSVGQRLTHWATGAPGCIGNGAPVTQWVEWWLADLAIPGLSPIWGEDLFNRKWGPLHRLSLSLTHYPDITEILFKRTENRNPSIHPSIYCIGMLDKKKQSSR